MAIDKLVDSTQLNTDLAAVANAIRAKGGTNNSLEFPNGFVAAIENISTGGVSEKDVNFIDYDGTILYSYTAEEFAGLSVLPANPTHEKLTAQGWNWTLAQITAQLAIAPGYPVFVGQVYTTTSGNTEIDIELNNPSKLTPTLGLAVNGSASIDWGDNSASVTLTGTSLTTRKSATHTYASVGKYTISISVPSGSKIALYDPQGTSGYGLLGANTHGTSSYARNMPYKMSIKAIRIGGNTEIGQYACYMCANIEYITLPIGITTIGTYGLSCLRSIQTFILPPGLITIESYACYQAHKVEYISLPPGIISIGNYGFSYCYNTKYFILPSSITTLGDCSFQQGYLVRMIAYSSNITTCGNSVFAGSWLAESINIPEGTKAIGNTCFSECFSINSSLVIPSTVESIGNQAFNRCTGVAEFHFLSEVPPTAGTSMFNYCSSYKIYVPYSADHSILDAYKAATNWSNYASNMYEEPNL